MVPARHILQASSDADLMHSYRETNNQEFLAALYLRYTALVFGTCMKYLKEADAAQDASMDIYQELVKKLPLHQVDNFKSWLFVVTKNHCLMKLRKDKKTIMVEMQPGIMQSEDFSHLDAVLEKEKELQQLENCIDQLNKDQQDSVRLFYLEQKCYNEIADITGLEWNKVRSLIQNGRRNLKICMEENE